MEIAALGYASLAMTNSYLVSRLDFTEKMKKKAVVCV